MPVVENDEVEVDEEVMVRDREAMGGVVRLANEYSSDWDCDVDVSFKFGLLRVFVLGLSRFSILSNMASASKSLNDTSVICCC